MKLTDLVTEHPGGWEDVIRQVQARWPALTVRLADPLWGRTTLREEASGEPRDAGTYRQVRDGELAGKYQAGLYLAALEHPTSGLLAHQAVLALRLAGLPVPGDKDWLKPAAKWKLKVKEPENPEPPYA